jgi:hypothetical protein
MGVFADKKGWIHIAHPSGLNGHFNAWICNSLGPGLKRIEAQNALSYVENKHLANCETEQCYVKSIARLSYNEDEIMQSKVITLTQGNINNSHFYLRDVMELFPPSSIGGTNKGEKAKMQLEIDWGSLQPVITDIAGDKKIFRKRGWIRQFFETHKLTAGSKIVVEHVGLGKYRVYPKRFDVH